MDISLIFIGIAIFCFMLAIGFIIALAVSIAYGDTDGIDPRYVCLYEHEYPYNEMCKQQRLDDIISRWNFTQ